MSYVIELHKLLSDHITSNIHYEWKCLRCGQCCKNVSLNLKEKNVITSYLRGKGCDNYIDKFESVLIKSKTPNMYLINGKCPLLTDNNTCIVYSVRPLKCRNFFCGRESLDEELKYDGKTNINVSDAIARNPMFALWTRIQIEKNKSWAREMGYNI